MSRHNLRHQFFFHAHDIIYIQVFKEGTFAVVTLCLRGPNEEVCIVLLVFLDLSSLNKQQHPPWMNQRRWRACISKPGPYIYMFWRVSDSYLAKVWELVHHIASAGSCNRAVMAAMKSFGAAATVKLLILQHFRNNSN